MIHIIGELIIITAEKKHAKNGDKYFKDGHTNLFHKCIFSTLYVL